MEVQLLEPLTALTNKLYQKGLESDLNAVMRRYEELKRDSKAKASRNLAVANIFGIMNSILGLVTALFSVISIFFTYYKNPNLSIYSSLVSAITAASLTAINPSKREPKRRKYYSYYSAFSDRVSAALVTTRNPSQNIWLKLSEIEEELVSLNNTMKELVD